MKCRTWGELADALGCSPQALRGWRKKPGAPTSKETKDWLEWREEAKKRRDDTVRTRPKEYWDALPGTSKYDEAFRQGMPFQAAVQREKVIAEEHKNRRELLEIEEREGRLVDRDEHVDRLKILARVFADAVDRCPPEILADLPADMARSVKARWKDAAHRIRSETAAKVRELS